VILGIVLITSTAIFLGATPMKTDQIFRFIGLSALLLVEIIYYVYSLNRINRIIALFFNSIRNEDTAFNIPIKSKNKVIYDIYKNLNRILIVFRDMKMSNEFREQLYLAMIEHSSTGFISIDEYGDFKIMNETSREILGVTHTSSLHRLKTEIPQLYKTIKELSPGDIKSCEIITAETNTIIQVSLSLLKFKGKSLKLISFQDIKKEIELRELESWQKLIRIMNHEIMNSIAPITSVSKSLIKIYKKNNLPVNTQNIDDRIINDTIIGLEVIDGMSSGLSHFVDNYRKLSKIPQPKLQKISIEKWICYLEVISKEIISDNKTELSFHQAPGCKLIYGDDQLLNQVLINLIKNAAEAPTNDDSKKIGIRFESNTSKKTCITVTNNGQPIDYDVIDKIFVPFFSTKEKGAGIGLFISRQIITLHGGTLSVKSNTTDGTSFTIEL
jgi:nitrogen fixation/metabolism regulation signal transduction histidine kinase